jgi:hypothetical protein
MQVGVSGICEPGPLEPGLSQSGGSGMLMSATDGNANRSTKMTMSIGKSQKHNAESLLKAAIITSGLRL